MICKDGHLNQADGCCCPAHGNTCGFCPEHNQKELPDGFSTFAEYLLSLPIPEEGVSINSFEDLAATSEAWAKRLNFIGD